jgi:hypothetical protein
VTITLPPDLAADLAAFADTLGLDPDEIVAHHMRRAVYEGVNRRERFLDTLDDHSRIVGWLPDGSPKTRD